MISGEVGVPQVHSWQAGPQWVLCLLGYVPLLCPGGRQSSKLSVDISSNCHWVGQSMAEDGDGKLGAGEG